MKAGGDKHNYSVSPFEVETGGGGVEDGESDEDGLGVEVGETCGKIKVEEEGGRSRS